MGGSPAPGEAWIWMVPGGAYVEDPPELHLLPLDYTCQAILELFIGPRVSDDNNAQYVSNRGRRLPRWHGLM